MPKRKKKKNAQTPDGMSSMPKGTRYKRSRWIALSGILLALVGGFLLFGWGAFSEAKSPRIVVTPPVYDFGSIPRLGGKVTYDVTVENQGEGTLTITSVGFS